MANCYKNYFFIDESGDPEFYGKRKKLLVGEEGYQPLLIMGMITTKKRKYLRKKVIEFRDSILSDPLYNTIESIKRNDNWLPHAKDDHPDVRAKFFELLRSLEGYKVYLVICRKDLEIFNKRHNNNSSEFYFDALHHLLKNRIFKRKEFYSIYLSHRKKTTLPKFEVAIKNAIERQKSRDNDYKYKFDIVKSAEFPELSIVDYLLWAIQRYIISKEERFYNALIDKYSSIVDLYDFDNFANRGNYYWRDNKFSLDKASTFNIKKKPFKDGYK